VAINPNLRATGSVISVEHLEGTSTKGNAYDFHTARVLIGGIGLCDITLPDGFVPLVGDDVDWKVEVTASGSNPRVRAVGPWNA